MQTQQPTKEQLSTYLPYNYNLAPSLSQVTTYYTELHENRKGLHLPRRIFPVMVATVNTHLISKSLTLISRFLYWLPPPFIFFFFLLGKTSAKSASLILVGLLVCCFLWCVSFYLLFCPLDENSRCESHWNLCLTEEWTLYKDHIPQWCCVKLLLVPCSCDWHNCDWCTIYIYRYTGSKFLYLYIFPQERNWWHHVDITFPLKQISPIKEIGDTMYSLVLYEESKHRERNHSTYLCDITWQPHSSTHFSFSKPPIRPNEGNWTRKWKTLLKILSLANSYVDYTINMLHYLNALQYDWIQILQT